MNVERVCDSRNCGNPMAGFNLNVKLVNDPDRPQNQILALVLACTRKPPTIGDKPNPDWNPNDMVDCARYTRGMDLCSLDCFLNQMEDLWKLGERRAKRLWETGERDWR